MVLPINNVYREILGPDFESLAIGVQRAHLAPLSAKGSLLVTHGNARLTPALVRMMNLPAAGSGQEVELQVEQAGSGLRWSRKIGATPLRTHQSPRKSMLYERSGVGGVLFRLRAENESLIYEQVAATFLGIPIPRSLAPVVRGIVSPSAEGWKVEVEITWRGNLVCRYKGAIRAI